MKFNNKNLRGPEKRAPALTVLITAAVFIAVFLVALWVLTAPSETTSSGYEASPDASATTKTSATKQQTFVDHDSSPSQEEKVEPNDVGDTPSETKQESTKPDDPQEESEKPEEETPGETEQSDDTSSQADGPKDEEDKPTTGENASESTDNIDVDDSSTDSTVDATPDTETEKAETQPAPGDKAELSIEKEEAPTSSLITQAKESKEEKIQDVIQKEGTVNEEDIVDEKKEVATQDPDGSDQKKDNADDGVEKVEITDDGKYDWKICTKAGSQDYIPCLDNDKAIKQLKSRKHFEHRERHCPEGKDLPTCLVPLPEAYKVRVDWPESRDKVWHANVPHDKLISYKHDQNWVDTKGDYLIFPGGGTQFKDGALQYIQSIEKTLPEITWGKHVRNVLDVGCGVASFGGYMFDKDVLTLSFAPKDEHEAQVQMALERGIPAMLSVMGTRRLTFPSNAFDLVHCARCRVPWHNDGGKLLLELNRILRPGGYFVWSATPVYRRVSSEVQIWKDTKRVTDAMCWKLIVRTKSDPISQIGIAVFQKPENNTCYDQRKRDEPPMCPVDDKADAAWYVDMNSCIHRIPTGDGVRATSWPPVWPARLEASPGWLKSVPKGIYGKPAFEEFASDTEHWQHVVQKSYFTFSGINWKQIRNVLDMKAVYGGFAAALGTQPMWVMNVIPTDEPDTLPVIYDRGLIGVYHDWCESFSTYPRTYDLLHADHVFVSVKKRCGILNTLIEMDRILRPNGWGIFRDSADMVDEIEEIVRSLHWEIKYSYIDGTERLLAAQKGLWRPVLA